ncbi:MAG: tyrosine-protein kinase family protein [Pseudorhodobacter sp.]|nr:MAG: tyrosine-protein kinase family protein [Pseudorhodobacter sp.]
MEFSAMTEDKSAQRQLARGATASLFRPGQTVAHPPMTLDLVKGREIFTAPLTPLRVNPAKVWESLSPVQLVAEKLTGNGLFPIPSNQPAAVAIDQLRSKLLHGLASQGWKRIAVTSPTHGCGKSFVATNLALSLARRPSSRTALIDLDLRRPHLANLLSLTDAPELADFLTGEQPLESVFRRFGRTLALGLNSAPVEMPAELLHSPDTPVALAAMVEQLDPEVAIYDMPPALGSDDLLAMAPSLDAVLLVVDGTKTSPAEVRACERLLEGRIPLLGVVLNRAQDKAAQRHAYGKV